MMANGSEDGSDRSGGVEPVDAPIAVPPTRPEAAVSDAPENAEPEDEHGASGSHEHEANGEDPHEGASTEQKATPLKGKSEEGEAVEEEPAPGFWKRRRQCNEEYRANTPHWRERLVPRTVLGMAVVLVAFSIGGATSGVSLYAYYQYRLDRENEFQRNYAAQFGGIFDNARKTIDADKNNARADIQKELAPLRANRADGETLIAMSKRVDPSVWFVQTTDQAGQAAVGSGFVVWSDGSRSLLVTSYTTVTASTHQPAPPVTVRKGNENVPAQLWTWDEEKDLALLIVQRPSLPKLEFQPQDGLPKLGERVFTVSGLGGSGVAIAQGFVADVSALGVQHDSPVGTAFQGGPVLNSEGRVVAVASRNYAPLGFKSEGVTFAPFPAGVCAKVLRCPGAEPGSSPSPPG